MKKKTKVAGTIIGSMIVLPVIVVIIVACLLYFPPFQNWAVQKVCAYASESMGMDVAVGHVALAYPLDLAVEEVKVLRANDSIPTQMDTIADISKTIVDMELWPLLHSQVEINRIELQTVRFNTVDFIGSARVKGDVKSLSLVSHGVDLSGSAVHLNDAILNGADVDVQLLDSVPEDTTETKSVWKITLDRLKIEDSRVVVNMPSDSLTIGACFANAEVKDAFLDLYKGRYDVSRFDWNGAIGYDNNYAPRLSKSFDYNHISLDSVAIGIDSLHYQAPEMAMKIRKGRLLERSGLDVCQLTGNISMDSVHVDVQNLYVCTPYSSLSGSVAMNLDALTPGSDGVVYVDADASIGKHDVLLFADDYLPLTLKKTWTYQPVRISVSASGNMRYVDIPSLSVELPVGKNAHLDGKGFVDLGAVSYRASLKGVNLPVRCMLPDMQLSDFSGNLTLEGRGMDPYHDMNLTAHAGISRFAYSAFDISGTTADVKLLNGLAKVSANISNSMISGTVGVNLNLNNRNILSSVGYNADLQTIGFPVRSFVPDMDVTSFTGHIVVDGHGLEPDANMALSANAEISRFKYSDFDFSGSTAEMHIEDGWVKASAALDNKKLSGMVSVAGMLNSNDLKATLECDLRRVDMYALNITETPLQTAFCAHVDVATDYDEYYKMEGDVSDIVIVDTAAVYHPDNLTMNISTSRDTTWAYVSSGDFRLDMNASYGYKKLLKVADNLSAELLRQLDNKAINEDSLRMVLPEGFFRLASGNNNFLSRYISGMGYSYRSLNADFTTSPVAGINGVASIDSLVANGMQFDRASVNLRSDDSGFSFDGQIENYKDNPSVCFKSEFEGKLFDKGADVDVRLYDADNRLGIKAGLKAMLENGGVRLQIKDSESILGYRKFTANKDNYFFLSQDNRVSAYLLLKDENGTGIHIYSDDDNTEALQDITIGINRLDLTSIVGIIPYFPQISGVLDGDFHLIQAENELSISTSLGVDKFIYEGTPLGNVATEFVYIPMDDGSHYVDGILLHDDDEVGTIKGTYSAEGAGYLDAKFEMDDLPLNLVNGFIPDQVVALKGIGNGVIDIIGPLSNLDVDGYVNLSSANIESVPYGIDMRFDDRRVRIDNSHLLLEDFNLYAHNGQKLTMNGVVDFTDVSNITMNVIMQARNFLLIDSKQNRRSEVYGKTYVNFNGMLQGRIEALKMQGKLDVLGTTDMTYILKDSPLTTDNLLEGLVEFTDFSAEDAESTVRPPFEGILVDMQISIAQGAHLVCALNATKSNYVDLFGGGDLRLVYTDDEMRLTGRYTLYSGEMKYSLPVIPLQTFTIQNGSYVEFTGDAMNPMLNIRATETVKSSVGSEGANRNVEFETGVVITKTLNDMGLEFIIDAPEDMQIHSELQTMGTEERAKLAVTMLTTGMYLTDSNMSSFTMNSALNSLLQSEINSITGNALRTLDLSLGLDNTTDATGALHTDYSFKFAKRFWDNRMRVVVGGKVSSNDALNQNLFDNIAIEYRLDQSANTNTKLFYDRSVYDYLEGYVGEYGVGIVWKRKLQNFSDIFRLRTVTNTEQLPDMRNDRGMIPQSVKTDSLHTIKPEEDDEDEFRID